MVEYKNAQMVCASKVKGTTYMSTMSKADRLLQAFKNGEELTARQIESRLNVEQGRGLVHQLRNRGYAIYLNERTDSRGNRVNRYRLGTPTRAVVAAGYRMLGSDFGMTKAA